MAIMPSRPQARQFAELLRTLEPKVKQAFMRGVVDLHSNVDWPALLSALDRQNITEAVMSLNISSAAWAEYGSAVTGVYSTAGYETAKQISKIKGVGIGIRFDSQNPRAERWIKQNVAGRVVGFSSEQIETAREVISEGYARGDGPRNIAVDLVGRVGPSGVREGGVLGLDQPRARRYNAVSVGMRTPEGVKSLVSNGKVRYKVNPATEARILAAWKSGTAVPEKQRLISERQYNNALLQQRAETVANTETAEAVLAGRQEQWEQAAEQKEFNKSDIQKTWQHRRGSQGREDHIKMNGVSVMGIDTPFTLPDGTQMKYPHDPAGGAENNISCACSCEYRLIRRVS